MSQISKAVFGALAISVACGAVQLAFGHDLTRTGQAAASESGVNRAAKADRDAVKPAAAPMRTFVLRFNGMPDASVLVRMPAAKDSFKQEAIKLEALDRPAPSMMRSGNRKNAIACETVVSVLTEVAKQLQPGRCVT